MRCPCKLNRSGWPGWLTRRLPAMDDPRPLAGGGPAKDRAAFTRMVSAIKIGPTWKTSAEGRHRAADLAALAALHLPRPTVLEVGAADGVTSLELMELMDQRKVDFASYMVTDRLPRALAARRGNKLFFHGPEGELLLAATPRWVVYADLEGGCPLSRWWGGRVLAAAPGLEDARPVELWQPELAARAGQDQRVELLAHDVFTPWPGPAADLVKAANLLNPEYFSQAQLRRALGHLGRALNQDGLLLVADNEPGRPERLRYSLLRRDGERLKPVAQEGGGARSGGLARELRLGGAGS
ncbi:MAG: hypothetical protein K9K66_05440 [Desulfarculaceae bacterium]|nr:hypothetical protein [Desulfarculaceae bacterium]MCF8072916.1 hypothetical protein [Desulfarculaceae bacterium]MCF8101084.1 hypothetical protein [Desulfarculaceae bacterium]MCF8115529.1 hypothetical protein [Desulfarculaceae bacterium]